VASPIQVFINFLPNAWIVGRISLISDTGRLAFFGDHAALADKAAFAAVLAALRKAEWVVYAKKPYHRAADRCRPTPRRGDGQSPFRLLASAHPENPGRRTMFLPAQYVWFEPVLIAAIVVFIIDLVGNSIGFGNRFFSALMSAIVFAVVFGTLVYFGYGNVSMSVTTTPSATAPAQTQK
jgi:hypothetical protein